MKMNFIILPNGVRMQKKTGKRFSFPILITMGIFFYSQWSFHRSLALALFLKVLPALSESMKWESF